MEKIKKEIIEKLLKTRGRSKDLVRRVKREVAAKYKTPFPKNSALLKTYRSMVKRGEAPASERMRALLLTRPVRSLSGIVNISVLTKPAPCPGSCIFCPTEKGFPKSYLSGEPAADRAKKLSFDPFLQVNTRLSSLKAQGHPVDKVELRVVGGTWSAYPASYQEEFIKNCFEAANRFPKKGKTSGTLKEAQKENETASSRIVGISVETRPDCVTKEEIKRLRELGVTFVELGVQTVFDKIHKKSKTNITTEKIAKATKLLKDAGFKILYQVMPNLPGSSFRKDVEMFKILFSDERFKPDWLKIYPTLVLENTPLFKIWAEGKFHPYTEEELVSLLKKVKEDLPPWVRVARIFRDIPAQKIKGGVTTSNIREVVGEEMKKEGKKCSCIRCREVRSRFKRNEKVVLFRTDYKASGGKEIFLSFENEKRTKLMSLLRLRITKDSFLPPLKEAALIREIQTFGPLVPIGEEKKGAQHKGLGTKLIKEAERIAKQEFHLQKMAIISGVGVRNYYRKKHGYQVEGTYMTKNL